MNHHRIVRDVEIDQWGNISAPWKDVELRSGTAFVALGNHVPEGHFEPLETLALHIVEQQDEIEELKNRITKLEDIIERIAKAFGPEEN